MNGARQQLTNATVYMVPVVIGNLVPIITLPIYTRQLSAEDFGAWALASAFAAVVSGVATVGLPLTYDRNFFELKAPDQRAQLLYSVVAFSSAAFAFCGAVTWLLRAPLTGWIIGDSQYEAVLVWSLGTAAVAGVKAYYMSYLRNTEQAKAFAGYTIVERLLTAVLTVGLLLGGVGALALVFGQLLAGLFVLVAIAARLIRVCPPAFDLRLLLDALKLGAPLLPRALFGVIGNNFDKYLIGQITSLGGVGIYSIGQRVANIAFTYMTALQNVFGPQVYTRMFSGLPTAGASIGRYLTPFAYASTVLAFLIALFSEEILTILAPAEYRGAIPIITILTLFYAIQFFGKMPQIAYARKTYIISVLAAVTTAVNMLFGALCIWMWGTVGAAWGALLAGATMTTVAFVIGQRCFRIDWEARKMTAIFGLLFASAFLVIGLRALDLPYAAVLLAKAGAMMAFVWLGVRLSILTAANLAMVRDMLRRRTAPAAGGAA